MKTQTLFSLVLSLISHHSLSIEEPINMQPNSQQQATPMRTSTPSQSLPTLPQSISIPLQKKLNAYLTHHLSFHRPIALVTSGGTIATLEKNTIRYLDNFSTGQRGAISVEEFCKRGYAVIHLWRRGSTAPYSRVFSKLLGCKQGNHALDFDALGYLFEGQQQLEQQEYQELDDDTDCQDKDKKRGIENVKNTVHPINHSYTDPWLSTTKRSKTYFGHSTTSKTTVNKQTNPLSSMSTRTNNSKYSSQNRMKLTSSILYNNLLQRKLRERADVIENNLLFTIPFTTIEEYIALLQLITEAMDQCQSLGLIYLAAAVSDFYIPDEDKAVHKIQSRSYRLEQNNRDDAMIMNGNDMKETSIFMDKTDNTLSLTLKPVPKVIKTLRDKWSPHAFCVSFKLETDETILRQKVTQALEKYDVHLIVGNVLDTRHTKVSLFQRKYDCSDTGNSIELESTEVTKTNPNDDSDDDDLEENIISHVVEKHFEYIANHFLNIKGDDSANDDGTTDFSESDDKNILPRTALMTGAEAAARHNAMMRKKKEKLQKELYWKRVKDIALNVAGHVLGCYLSFTLSSALQKRIHS